MGCGLDARAKAKALAPEETSRPSGMISMRYLVTTASSVIEMSMSPSASEIRRRRLLEIGSITTPSVPATTVSKAVAARLSPLASSEK